LRSILFIFLTFTLISCAKTAPEKIDEAIDLALTYLTQEKCQKAIDVLEDVGPDTDNPVYLQVLASAYACRGGYNEITFLSTDIPAINSAAATFMKSLSKLTLSPETAADSDSYNDLLASMNTLLYVDDNQPSYAARVTKYGARKAGDMGVQTLFLGLAQLGKFINFYGNVDSSGTKGAGAANTDEQGATPSNCFLEYTEARSIAALGVLGGTCDDMSSDNGHPNLSFAPASLTATKKKMCQGLVLVTNLIDILENITLPANSSYGSITSLPTTVSAFKSSIIAADATLETLLETTSQTTCETLVAGATEFDNLQYIYALLFEVGLP
jgi:hypothetical protein